MSADRHAKLRATTGRIRKVLVGGLATVAIGAGSYSLAGAATSFHGSDYTQNYNGINSIRTCDKESDSNKVKGGWSIYDSGGETDSITDGDGNNGVCASQGGTIVRKHHTCERNWVSWDCDNWQST